jgi:hypothetical protein
MASTMRRRPTRRPVFFALVAMHVGILLTVDFADLTLGMLLAHLFAWDAVAGRVQPADARNAASRPSPRRRARCGARRTISS